MSAKGLFNYKVVICLFTLAGCTTSMPTIVKNCDSPGSLFPQIANCIESTYSQKGAKSESIAVRSFFSELAVIRDQYLKQTISNDQARADLYRAYANTIQPEIDREQQSQPVVCTSLGFNRTVICQ